MAISCKLSIVHTHFVIVVTSNSSLSPANAVAKVMFSVVFVCAQRGATAQKYYPSQKKLLFLVSSQLFFLNIGGHCEKEFLHI